MSLSFKSFGFLFTISILLMFGNCASAQTLAERYAQWGEVIVMHLSSAPFPHRDRDSGHTYRGIFYSREEHYADSSVLVFIPKGIRPGNKTDIIVYFHGWFNCIDSALAQFNLIEQFCGANKNAVFVFPEGPRNAPDSFGGKLEDENGFQKFIADLLNGLVEKKITTSKQPGKIILAGHSGAYHAMSYILFRGGLTKNISDVILFDALYGQTEKFFYWLEHSSGRLINIYTDDGGTKGETLSFLEELKQWKYPLLEKQENEISDNDLARNRIIFIHSNRSHNEVISSENQFLRFLRSSQLGERR